MPEYRNTKTGVVVDVPESVAASLRSYERVDAAPARESKQEEKPAPRRGRPRKSD